MVPSGRLAEVVDLIWLHEGSASEGVEWRLPTGRVELVINLCVDRCSVGDGLCGRKEFPGAIAVGPFARPYAVDRAQQSRVLGVVFKPGAARPLLGVSLHELSDRHVALAELWGAGAVELRERALTARGPRERLAEVESVLGRRLVGAPDLSHPLAAAAVAWMSRAPAGCGVAELSDRLGWTPRRLEQVFRAEVGLTPRSYRRLARFRSALAGIDAVADRGWSAFALEHGYYDQSHFIREFRAHAGLSPSAYLRVRGPALNHVTA